MLRRVFSMVRVRVPFFFFLQVKSFFNGLDCFLNNEDSPTSVHSLSLEFHIHDLFHISIQIVCQRLSLVIHTYYTSDVKFFIRPISFSKLIPFFLSFYSFFLSFVRSFFLSFFSFLFFSCFFSFSVSIFFKNRERSSL